jgi:hypothetical protein
MLNDPQFLIAVVILVFMASLGAFGKVVSAIVDSILVLFAAFTILFGAYPIGVLILIYLIVKKLAKNAIITA